ncbi:hypothetical protein C7E18_23740, partial [Stenotrophomonas maltophilia]
MILEPRLQCAGGMRMHDPVYLQRVRELCDAHGALFDQHPGEICAVILEPRLQCAGGMRMHDPVYLQRVRELCDAHGA